MYAELNYMHCECVIFVYIELNYTVNVLYLYILNSFALINEFKVEFINWGEYPTVKTFGLLQPYFGCLSCMPVVCVTHYKFQGWLPISF